MNPITFNASLIGFLFAAGAQAQLRTVTPQKYNRSEAPAAAYYLGGWKEARMQFADSYLTGLGAKTIKQVGYRLDYRHSSSIGSGVGKSWTNVKLMIAHTDVTKTDKTFTRNHLTPPTMVFSGSVTWATLRTGFPPSRPAPFDSMHAFPFSTPWSYRGTKDIVLDYKFTGGTLANNRAWTSTESRPTHYLDAPVSQIASQMSYRTYGKGTTADRCRDRRQSRPAHCAPSFTVFAKNTGIAAYDNQVIAAMSSYLTAPRAPVVHAMSIGSGSSAGVPFPGVSCNNLYVDPVTVSLYPTKSSASGFGNTSFGKIPWNPVFGGVTLWFQSAWNDSSSGLLRLSMAARGTLPASQPADPLPRNCVYDTSGARTFGIGPAPYDQMNPLIQWTH